MTINTIKFSKLVAFTEATVPNGASITHDNAGTFTITSSTGDGSNAIQYDGTWDVSPGVGDVATWSYDGSGDIRSIEQGVIFEDNFNDTPGRDVLDATRNLLINKTGNLWGGGFGLVIDTNGTQITAAVISVINIELHETNIDEELRLMVTTADGVQNTAQLIFRRQVLGNNQDECYVDILKTFDTNKTAMRFRNTVGGSVSTIGSLLTLASVTHLNNFMSFRLVDDGVNVTCTAVESGEFITQPSSAFTTNVPSKICGLGTGNLPEETFFDNYRVISGIAEPLPAQDFDLTNCLDNQNGFPLLGTDSNNILSAKLTSASELGGGVVGGSAAYDPVLGVKLSGASGLYFQDTPGWEDMATSGRISFEIEAQWVNKDYVPALTELAISCNGGGELFRLERLTDKVFRTRAKTSPVKTPRLASEWVEQSMVRIDLSWEGAIMRTYVDYLLVHEESQLSTPFLADTFRNIFCGAHGTGSPDAYMRNFEASTEPLTLDDNSRMAMLIFMGDSFPNQGQPSYILPAALDFNLPIIGDINDYWGDSGSVAGSSHLDYGMQPTLQRRLAEANYHTTQVWSYAHGGDKINPASSNRFSYQVDNLLTGSSAFPSSGLTVRVPNIVVIYIGTNDVSTVPEQDWVDWRNEYLVQINRLFTAGAKKIVVCSTATRQFNDPTLNDVIDRSNASLDILVSSTANVYLADTFLALGGHHNDPNGYFFSPGDIHASPRGQKIIGETIANVVRAII